MNLGKELYKNEEVDIYVFPQCMKFDKYYKRKERETPSA